MTVKGDMPTHLAAWVRSHWHIDNKLHWVRDVTYREDSRGATPGPPL
jgi:predicted transposase YbfD/YdcC